MTDLRERLHHTVDDQHTDLAVLAALAQSHGSLLRRRHLLNVAGGSLAMAAVLVVFVAAATQLLPGPPEAGPVTGFATQGEATVPVTARSLTAALQAAVSDVADGTASGFEGFHSSASASETHDPLDDSPERDGYEGWLTFSPADGSGSALVLVGLGDKAGMDYNQRTAEENFSTCTSVEEDCKVITLRDGSMLKTYVSHSIGLNGGDRSYETLTAERMLGDAVVSVSASNGGDVTGAGNEVTRPHAVLSLEQLIEIVSQPWWGYDLPQEFADAGDALPSYHESDSAPDKL